MIFPYREITPRIKRPIIRIILKSSDTFVVYPALIDSGADYCIFSIELAKPLNIKLSKHEAPRSKLRGIKAEFLRSQQPHFAKASLGVPPAPSSSEQALRFSAKGNKVSFQGVGKDKVQGYWGEVEIRVGRISYKTKAIFAEISEFGHGILGQRGFFDIFIVKFDLIKKEIEIKPRRISRLPKGTMPTLSKKYSDKKIRDIAIESHISKYKRSLN